jgi:phage major head subunit gpT-like protein
MLINTENLQALHTMLSAAYAQGISKADVSFQDIANTLPSNNKSNSYAWLGAMSGVREWLGDRVVDQLSGHTYELKNRTWEKTISVLKEDIEDDQLGMAALAAEDLGNLAQAHKSRHVWETLAAGEVGEGYDKVPFFSEVHPDGMGGTQSNLIAGASAPWYVMDLSRTLKPLIFQLRKDVELVSKTNPEDHNVFWNKTFVWGTDARYAAGYAFWQTAVKSKVALTEDNLAAARARMRGFHDDQGEPLACAPTTLVVGVSNETTAEKLLQNLVLANGESNINKGKYRLARDLEVLPRLGWITLGDLKGCQAGGPDPRSGRAQTGRQDRGELAVPGIAVGLGSRVVAPEGRDRVSRDGANGTPAGGHFVLEGVHVGVPVPA